MYHLLFLKILSNMGLSTILMANKVVFSLFIGRLETIEILGLKSELVQYALMIVFGVVQFSIETFSANTFLLLAALLVFKFYDFVIKYRIAGGQCRPVRHGTLLVILAASCGFASYRLYISFFQELRESLLNDELDEMNPSEYFFLAVETTCVTLELVCLFFKLAVGAATGNRNDLVPWVLDTVFLFMILCIRSFYTLFGVTIGYAAHITLIYPIGFAYGEFAKAYSTTKRMLTTERALSEKLPVVDMREFPNVDNTCLVCRDQITHGRLMPCGHTFHDECIKPWILDQGTCPVCFKDALQTNSTYEDTMNVLHRMNESNKENN